MVAEVEEFEAVGMVAGEIRQAITEVEMGAGASDGDEEDAQFFID